MPKEFPHSPKHMVSEFHAENPDEVQFIVKEMFSLDTLPPQTITKDEENVYGQLIRRGIEGAKDEYISRRLVALMKIAKKKYDRQLPAVNLALEDHFQDVLEKYIQAIDKYDIKKGIIFSRYMGMQLFWLVKSDASEVNALPLTKMGKEYHETDAEFEPIFTNGLVPINEIDTEIQGSGTKEIVEDVALTIASDAIQDALIQTLSPRNKAIVNKVKALEGRKEKTLDEIAWEFDLTRERIRQIGKKGEQSIKTKAEVQWLKGIFEDVPESDFLQQNTPPSLYQVQRAIDRRPLFDPKTPKGRSLKVFIDTWKPYYFPKMKNLSTQTEMAKARFRKQQIEKIQEKTS